MSEHTCKEPAQFQLKGARCVLDPKDAAFPEPLKNIPYPPKKLYVVGNVDALGEGLAVIGARKATPYGKSCVQMLAGRAASKGVVIISGGAYGCDAAAHQAALDVGGTTVAFLGGGCNKVYPRRNLPLFQAIVDSGGAVVSEQDWDFEPLPYTFRQRNRLIAGLAKATLIVEAGLPSGTFSTADEALAANKEVLVVPGPITSPSSTGSNRLLYQGALPIVDTDSLDDVLFSLFGVFKECEVLSSKNDGSEPSQDDPLLAALMACPLRMDEMHTIEPPKKTTHSKEAWLFLHLSELERDGIIARYPDGRYGPAKVMR